MWYHWKVLAPMSYGLIRDTVSKTLTSESTVLIELPVNNVEFLTVELETVGSPLLAFSIKMKGHNASPFATMFSTADDFSNPKGLLRGASCDLTTLNGTGWLMLDVRGIADVCVTASSSNSTDITVRVGG